MGSEWMEKMRKWNERRVSKDDIAEYNAAANAGGDALTELEERKGTEWMEKVSKWYGGYVSKEDIAEYVAAANAGDEALTELEARNGSEWMERVRTKLVGVNNLIRTSSEVSEYVAARKDGPDALTNLREKWGEEKYNKVEDMYNKRHVHHNEENESRKKKLQDKFKSGELKIEGGKFHVWNKELQLGRQKTYSGVFLATKKIITSKSQTGYLIGDLITIFDLTVEYKFEKKETKVMFKGKERPVSKVLIEILEMIGKSSGYTLE